MAKSKILTEGVLRLHILLPQSRYRSTAPSRREQIKNLRRRPLIIHLAEQSLLCERQRSAVRQVVIQYSLFINIPTTSKLPLNFICY